MDTEASFQGLDEAHTGRAADSDATGRAWTTSPEVLGLQSLWPCGLPLPLRVGVGSTEAPELSGGVGGPASLLSLFRAMQIQASFTLSLDLV